MGASIGRVGDRAETTEERGAVVLGGSAGFAALLESEEGRHSVCAVIYIRGVDYLHVGLVLVMEVRGESGCVVTTDVLIGGYHVDGWSELMLAPGMFEQGKNRMRL